MSHRTNRNLVSLVNANNQLTQWGDASGTNPAQPRVTQTYDANGHLLTKTVNPEDRSQAATTSQRYRYNLAERLIQVADSSQAEIASYSYDPFGRRIRKTVSQTNSQASGQSTPIGTTTYLYADEGLLAEADTSGDITTTYGWIPNGIWGTAPQWKANVTLGSNTGSNTNPAPLTYHYFHNDHLGSSQRLTNDQGVLTWSARMEAFGKTTTIDSIITNLINGQSQTVLMPTTTVNNLRFAGQIEDGETGTFYNWHRDYVPVTGHYIESDPIGLAGGVNTYVYVSGRPIRKVDSFGLWATDAHNYFIRRAFPNLPSDMRAAIERGSANADRWAYQDDCNSYMHAMSSACLTVAKARKKMCKYVKTNLSSYNNLLQSNDIGSQIGACFLLGMALHPIMDSISPEHQGFQYWDTATNWKEHGPWPTSKEKGEVARETQYRMETLELMRLAVAGDLSLIGCQ